MLNLIDTTKDDNNTKVKGDSKVQERLRLWLEERIAAGKKKPTAEVVTLVPALAALLLERNPVNRPISKQNANELKSDVASQRFVFNGESIVVSDTGVLMDGQHRCLTVVETGVPIETAIVFGPKEAARFTIDTGRSKTVSNFLAMKGRHYTHALGAACGYIVQWKQGGKINYAGDQRPSKQTVLAAADELKGIDDSVEFTQAAMKTVRSHAVLAFCHWVFWKKSSREAADAFMSKLIEGDGLKKGDPILWCRNKLIASSRGVHAGDRAELIFKTWNAHRLGQTITAFRVSGGPLPKVER